MRCISTPIVSNDVVVAQVVPTGDSGYEATPGHIRGYDVRTGERLWIFHVVPQGDDFGVDTWENESWRYTGHSGVWTQLTVDEELGYLYLPTEITLPANPTGSPMSYLVDGRQYIVTSSSPPRPWRRRPS